MRNEKKKTKPEKRKQSGRLHLLPKSPALSVVLLAVFLFEIVFMLLLSVVDVLPGKYMSAVFILILALDAVVMILLNSRKEKTVKRKAGTVLSALLIIGFAVGSYYLYSTYSMFGNISDEDRQTEDFHVIVLKDSEYEKIEDIKGKTVYVTENETDTYREAKGRLMSEAEVKYEADGSYLDIGHKLVDEKGEMHNSIIFVNNTSYEMQCEEIDGFEKGSKIIYTVSVDISSSDIAKRIDVTRDPFNIYISGIDTIVSIDKVSRSDVNMIMTVNPKEKEILLTSIPRDTYVTLHSYGAKDKLTHSGIYGIEETVTTAEDWLDIDINYYIRVNFTTLMDIVDVIGGVDVESAYAFSSSVSGYSYSEGTNHLDGEGALYFARERKSLNGGDNERIKNQQRVLKGIIEKVTSSTVILTRYTQLLNAVGDKLQTNLTDKDISELVKMQLADLGGWSIKSISVEGKGKTAETYSMGSRGLYVMEPDADSVEKVRQTINSVMYPSER